MIKLDKNSDEILKKLLEHNILGGVPLKSHYPELGEAVLVATTEVHNDEDYEHYLDSLKRVLGDVSGSSLGGEQ